MKHPIHILFFLIPLYSSAQIIQSSCEMTGDSSDIQDAEILALREIVPFITNPYYDSIDIPVTYSQPILSDLMAVRNATGIPEVDTVNSLLHIHTFPAPEIHEIILSADTSILWVYNLYHEIFPTGNNMADSIITLYDIYVPYQWSFPGYGTWIIIRSPQMINALAMSNYFATQPGIIESSTGGVIGDGSDIVFTHYTEFDKLTYSYGWGDCPSGCIARRYWDFYVYSDCGVEFMSSYGDALTGLPSDSSKQPVIFPNPFKEDFSIELPQNGEYFLTIADAKGSIIDRRKVSGKEYSLSFPNLPAGLYCIEIEGEGTHFMGRIVKL